MENLCYNGKNRLLQWKMSIHPNSLKNLNRSKWRHGKTKLIRVPEELSDEILAYAHMLDDGITSTYRQELREIVFKIDSRHHGYRANSASQLIKKIKELCND